MTRTVTRTMTRHATRLAMTAFVAAIAAMSFAQSAPAAEPAVTGLWQKIDEQTGSTVGWFLFTNQNGLYEGAIAKLFLRPSDQPNPICSNCRDDRKDEPLLGLPLIRNMQRNGLTYRERQYPRSARRQCVQRDDAGQSRRPDADRARLSRRRLIRDATKPGIGCRIARSGSSTRSWSPGICRAKRRSDFRSPRYGTADRRQTPIASRSRKPAITR